MKITIVIRETLTIQPSGRVIIYHYIAIFIDIKVHSIIQKLQLKDQESSISTLDNAIG